VDALTKRVYDDDKEFTMSAIKERAIALIQQMSDEDVISLLEDLEDMVELRQAIQTEKDEPSTQLDEVMQELKNEGVISE
jgi:hypothetical protein